MAHAAVKLESFTPCVIAEPSAAFTQDDLDRAREEGLAEGAASARDEQVRELLAAMRQLCAEYSDSAERTQKIYLETIESLQPVLAEIVEALAPTSCSSRLETALMETFEKLGQSETPGGVRITCGSKLKDIVDRCLSDSGLSAVEVEYDDSREVSLSLSGGRIEFSQDRITREFRKLIEEITENSANGRSEKSD